MNRVISMHSPSHAITTSARMLSIVLLGAITSLFILAGCDSNTGPATPAVTGEDPTGGTWKTFVVPTVAELRLTAPAAEPTQELQELSRWQMERTPAISDTVAYWDHGATIRWNEIARSLVIKYKTTPPAASRVYALLSVAQYDALVAAWDNKYLHKRPAPSRQAPDLTPIVAVPDVPAYPSEHSVIAGVSADLLSYLYPAETAYLQDLARQHGESRMWAGASLRSDVRAGDSLGRRVARAVIERAKTDGAEATWIGTVPTGSDRWYSSEKPAKPPLLPLWGNVKPWLMTSGTQFRPAPPPAMDSPQFKAALKEVADIARARTEEQIRIAKFWADGAGTYTPAGHWNEIASNLIKKHGLRELRAARTLALMNTAVMDAGICCWDAKYAYWLLRPSQADTTITLAVGLPNFPAYTSGHSSFSAAAATVLGYIFPGEATSVTAMAEEAAMSRIYGGIHYRFDSEVGLEGGRKVANLAIARGRADGAP